MSNSNQMDMASLMSMLSKMDKNQLEQGLSKLNQMLSSEDKEKIMREFQKGSQK